MSALPAHWLKGKTALIVGSGAAADAVAEAVVKAGATAARCAASIVEAADIAAKLDQSGEIDLLVHAGTPLPGGKPEALSLAIWRETFSADLDGRFLFAAEFARRRIAAESGGNILLLMPPYRIEAGRALAGSSQGALDNLVKSLASEWGRDGIRINGIASRTVEDFAGQSRQEQQSLCNLAAYLLSDYAAYVTGMICGIDEA